MAKFTGKNAAVKFGSTTYNCLNGLTIDGRVSIAEIECSADTGNAVTHKAVGAESWSVSTTLVLDGASTTVVSALDVGTSGALEAYVENDTAAGGFAKYAWTTAYVETHSLGSGPSTFGTLDVTFQCDGGPTVTAT